MKHLEGIAKELGNLRYDYLVGFIYDLATELEKHDEAYYSFRCMELSSRLQDTSGALREANIPLKKAWEICRPFMGSSCLRHPVKVDKGFLGEISRKLKGLKYDSLVGFIYDLAADLDKQADKDFFRGRVKLSVQLSATADALRNANAPLKRVCEFYENVRKEVMSDS